MSIKRIRESLDGHLPAQGRILVALSGGVDSMVALHATQVLRPDLSLVAAHVHHGLRDEADADVALCQETCDRLGVHLYVRKADIKDLARERNVSLELAGRQVRHHFFHEIRDQEHCDAVVLGHHADDRVETVLHNFMRGSGVHGLGAMKEWSGHNRYLRPLLGLTKKEVIEIANDLNVTWHEDASNAETDFDRNEVVPMLETRRSGVKQSILRASEAAEDISDYMRMQARNLIKDHIFVHSNIEKTTFFDMSVIQEAHPALKAELIQYLWTKLHGSSAGFSQKRVSDTLSWLDGPLKNGSSLYFGEGIRLCNRNGRLGAVTTPEVMDRAISSMDISGYTSEETLTSIDLNASKGIW
jgi:tRNA(Ile)-lysidine synthase